MTLVLPHLLRALFCFSTFHNLLRNSHCDITSNGLSLSKSAGLVTTLRACKYFYLSKSSAIDELPVSCTCLLLWKLGILSASPVPMFGLVSYSFLSALLSLTLLSLSTACVSRSSRCGYVRAAETQTNSNMTQTSATDSRRI